MSLDQVVPIVGPLTAAQLAAAINVELAELYKRSFAKVTGASGTNTYTGSITPTRTLEDGNGFVMEVPNANTSACTYNGKALVSSEGAALQSGQLAAGQSIAFVYDMSSDHYRIVTPLSTGTTPIVRVYGASDTWSKPAGLRYVRVKVQAPGGGGGGASGGTGSAGGGGGAGGYGERIIAASALSATEAVTIGAVGAGGSSGSTGSTGGAASFGALVTTNGGLGGVGSASPTGGVVGGAGGASGTGGDVNLSGRPGSPGVAGAASGNGGDSAVGGAGANGNNAGTTGATAPNYGGGGAGGYVTGSNRGGGAGGPGVIIVEEFY